MIFKKKEFFLLIFLIFLQSCSGGRIGNFLESSFNDLEKTSKNEDLQNNLLNKKDINLEKENKKFDDKKNKKIKKVVKPKNVPENKKDVNLEKENKKFDDKKNKKINFLIGDTDRINSDIKKNSDLILSLSPLTFPHELARLILIEQIYRAISISNNSPYHRS